MDDHLQHKPGQFKIENTKNKYGVGLRYGGTLRKNSCLERNGSAHRNNSLILKHVSTTEGWDPDQVEYGIDFDDGGLQRHTCHRQNTKRGKGARSSVAKQPAKQCPTSTCVTYSMNKRNRWLLPTTIKEEIEQQKADESVYGPVDVNLTLVERELCQQAKSRNRPDTLAVASTSLEEKENSGKTKKHRKSKRRAYYSHATDLLKLSQTRDGENCNDTEHSKPDVTFEICNPRLLGPYTSVRSDKKSSVGRTRKEKEKRPKKGKNHYHGEDAIQYYRARKSHNVFANDLI